MKSHGIKYGIINGVIASILIVLSASYMGAEASYSKAELMGYISMILGFGLIFLGIYQNRKQQEGAYSFKQGFLVGLTIVVVTSVFYVASWMILTDVRPEVEDQMFEMMKSSMDAEEMGADAYAEKLAEMEETREQYRKPMVKLVFTFIEIFPVGLVMALIAALVFRRK